MQLNEVLLGAWLKISTAINNSRLVSEMSYNESLICNILYRNATEQPSHALTATDLCAETKILKSQMNRILTQLEDKNLITRERSAQDKRKIFVRLTIEQSNAYLKQHEQILKLLDDIIEKLGEEKTLEIIDTLNGISDVAGEIIK
ncbi:MAG: MarR family transcriptional regulator [Lachnospiraceae bacterium]|nr:MarR family transcriptional regulator [Lachnospiraceae bacterium]